MAAAPSVMVPLYNSETTFFLIKWALLLHCTKFVGGWGQQEGVKKAQTRKKLMFAILLLLTFFLDDPVEQIFLI